MPTSETDSTRLTGSSSPENHYREMFEHSVAGMYRSSAGGRLLEANQALADILGYDSIDELYELDLGRDVYANATERERLLQLVERDGVVRYIEIELQRKDGSRITAMGSMRGIRDTDGRLAWMEGTLVDISEREEATRALKASEQRYRHLVEGLTDGVFETTPGGRMLRANRALVEMLGYDSEEELLAVPVSELYADPASRDAEIAQALEAGGIRNRELRLRRKDGEIVDCLQNSRILYENGEPVRFEGTLTDLSDLRRHEAERRELEARRERQNRALLELTRADRPHSREDSWRLATRVAAQTLELAHVGIWLLDGESLRCACMWSAEDESYSSGMEVDVREFPAHIGAVRGQRVLAADEARTDPRTAELSDSYLEPRGISSMLDVPIRRGASMIGILCHEHAGPVRHWTEDEIDFAASIAGWISQEFERHERRQAQERLLASEKKYRDLFESTVSGFFRVDPAGYFLAANPAFLEMLGYESEAELEGVNLAEDIYVDHGDRPSLAAAIAGEPLLQNVESELRRRDGSIVRVFGNIRRVPDEDSETLYYEGSFVDVTERAELEIQLRQSQKMEALGKLAGGVAHDFNNLITVMLGYIDLALGKVETDSTLVGDLEQIRDAAERAAAMTRHLLAYTRQQVLHPRLLDLNDAITDVSRLLERLIGEDIELVLELAEEASPIRVDPGQLQQVIINLAVNARDAMREGGRLTIRTHTELIDRPRRMPDFVIEPGRYAVVTVLDDGQGMDEDTLSHALEPFFTTKPVGQGTGLGLSTAYGIVKQSGGYLSLASEVGRGTEIDLYLPSSGGDDTEEAEGVAQPTLRTEGNGKQIVLLVEDDRTLRELATSVLESEGYHVVAPDGPHEALALFDQEEESFDLLLTDVVMPGLSGLELAQRLRDEHPDLPVLLVSGYPPELSAGGESFEVDEEFLAKPFGPQELVERVRQLLDRRSSE